MNPTNLNPSIKLKSEHWQALPKKSKKSDQTNFENKPFYFSNERHVHRQVDFLQNKELIEQAEIKHSCAILVGESNINSLAAALSNHVETVIFLDINPVVLAHNQYLLETLINSPNPEVFFANYTQNDNPALKSNHSPLISTRFFKNNGKKSEQYSSLASTLSSLVCANINEQMMGEKSYLSDENFEQNHKAAKKLKFVFAHVDIFDSHSVQAFKKELDKRFYKIKLINCTNLYDYDSDTPLTLCHQRAQIWKNNGKLKTSLESLTKNYSDDVVIFYSKSRLMETVLDAYVIQSITSYLADITQHNTFHNSVSILMEKYKATNFGMALRRASFNGDENNVRELLKIDENFINQAVPENKLTALHYAFKQNHLNCAKALFEHGGDIFLCDFTGKTPLDYTSEAIKNYYLILNKYKTTDGAVALRRASFEGAERDVIELIEIDKNLVNQQSPSNQQTALHYALRKNHANCAKILIEHGANVDSKDNQGKTPFDYAREDIRDDLLSDNRSLYPL